MALTHALSTNNYGPAKLIVATSAANGTHTTLAGAMADAVSGDTIFLRDSVTENVTLIAGVNIAAWQGGTLNTPSITGTLTMTAAGTCNISGVRLVTNSAVFLAVTGNAASIVNLNNCFLNASNNDGITFSSSSASASIRIEYCKTDLATSGIKLFAHSSSGVLSFRYVTNGNSGGSSTASTCSAGTLLFVETTINHPITLSGTGSVEAAEFSIDTSATNTTALTLGGGSQAFRFTKIASGSASAVTISTTASLESCTINSSNTNAVTGAGTLLYSNLIFDGSSNVINTTTQTALINRPGITRSGSQPAFLATSAGATNQTGDTTQYTIVYGNEIFDQNGNYDPSTGIFTAPYTGRYQFNITTEVTGLGVANTSGNLSFIATSRSINTGSYNWGAIMSSVNTVRVSAASLIDMTAGDTCFVRLTISGGTKIVGVGATNTTFSGFLVC